MRSQKKREGEIVVVVVGLYVADQNSNFKLMFDSSGVYVYVFCLCIGVNQCHSTMTIMFNLLALTLVHQLLKQGVDIKENQ